MSNTTSCEHINGSAIVTNDAKCILIVVDTIDCIKKPSTDVIGLIIGKFVRGAGTVLSAALQKFNFSFLFQLPVAVFDASTTASSTQARSCSYVISYCN